MIVFRQLGVVRFGQEVGRLRGVAPQAIQPDLAEILGLLRFGLVVGHRIDGYLRGPRQLHHVGELVGVGRGGFGEGGDQLVLALIFFLQAVQVLLVCAHLAASSEVAR